jgi:hypothetical protein
MSGRIARAALAIGCVAMLAAGCSSSGHNVAAGIDLAVQNQLRQDIQNLAAAAAAHNTAGAQAALNALTADTAAARVAGKLSDTKLTQIRAAAAAIQTDLARPASPSTTVPRTPTPSPPTHSKGGKDNGKGGGHGGD